MADQLPFTQADISYLHAQTRSLKVVDNSLPDTHKKICLPNLRKSKTQPRNIFQETHIIWAQHSEVQRCWEQNSCWCLLVALESLGCLWWLRHMSKKRLCIGILGSRRGRAWRPRFTLSIDSGHLRGSCPCWPLHPHLDRQDRLEYDPLNLRHNSRTKLSRKLALLYFSTVAVKQRTQIYFSESGSIIFGLWLEKWPFMRDYFT